MTAHARLIWRMCFRKRAMIPDSCSPDAPDAARLEVGSNVATGDTADGCGVLARRMTPSPSLLAWLGSRGYPSGSLPLREVAASAAEAGAVEPLGCRLPGLRLPGDGVRATLVGGALGPPDVPRAAVSFTMRAPPGSVQMTTLLLPRPIDAFWAWPWAVSVCGSAIGMSYNSSSWVVSPRVATARPHSSSKHTHQTKKNKARNFGDHNTL